MRLKPTLKSILILTLIVVALFALVLASGQASVQQNAFEKTQGLFSIFQNANVTVSKVFRQLEADGKTVPQAGLDAYNEALVLAGDSESLLHAGNYSEADGKIVQALQKLKEALRIIYEVIPDQPTEEEISLERASQLSSSISRYYEQLQRIENLTRLAASAGYNTTALEDKIQNIKNLLDNASSNVEQKRFEAASENLADAKSLSDRILSYINSFAADLKIQKIATYINQTRERLSAIRETAETFSNEAALAAVNSAETSLDNANQYLAEQRINETLSELANSKANEDKAVEYLTSMASAVNATANKISDAIKSP